MRLVRLTGEVGVAGDAGDETRPPASPGSPVYSCRRGRSDGVETVDYERAKEAILCRAVLLALRSFSVTGRDDEVPTETTHTAMTTSSATASVPTYHQNTSLKAVLPVCTCYLQTLQAHK